jgi:ketosteroid isomerase-like protein
MAAGMSRHADTVRRLFDLRDQGRVSETLEHYADDAVLYLPTHPSPLRGRDAIAGYLEGLAESGVIAKLTSLQFEQDGDRVLVTGRIWLRDPEGSISDSPGAWIFEFQDEKVAVVRGFRDPGAAREALDG